MAVMRPKDQLQSGAPHHGSEHAVDPGLVANRGVVRIFAKPFRQASTGRQNGPWPAVADGAKGMNVDTQLPQFRCWLAVEAEPVLGVYFGTCVPMAGQS